MLMYELTFSRFGRLVYPSSTIQISVYRQRNVLHVLEDQEIGKFEARLVTYLNDGKSRLSGIGSSS